MGWLYLPAVEGSSSDSTSRCPTTPRSVTWRGKPIQPRVWQREWKKESFVRRLSGTTLEPSMADRIAARWISSLPASRVSPSRSREDSAHKKTSGGCGRTSLASFATFDRGSCSSKTCPVCSLPLAERAYVAGLIDGEGCIGIVKDRKGYFYPRVDVGMAEPGRPLLNALHAHFGGSMSQNRPDTAKWSASFRWSLQGKTASDFCRCIAPLLKLKGAQARLAASDGLNGETKTEIHRLNQKGPIPGGWIARRVGAKWIAPPTLFDQSPTFSESWPSSGSMRSGRAFERRTSERHTSGVGSSFWPGVSATPYGSSQNNPDGSHYRPSNGTPSLHTLARKWASPQAHDATSGNQARLWRTPDSGSQRGGPVDPEDRKAGGHSVNLQDQAASCPTVTAGDGKASGSRNTEGSKAHQGTSLTDVVTTGSSRSGRQARTTEANGRRVLNPRFTEALMGWPTGWTAFEPVGTEWSLWLRRMRWLLWRAVR